MCLLPSLQVTFNEALTKVVKEKERLMEELEKAQALVGTHSQEAKGKHHMYFSMFPHHFNSTFLTFNNCYLVATKVHPCQVVYFCQLRISAL